jgi:hypothetical protein
MEQIALDEIRGSPPEQRLHETREHQLLTLIGELLETNQALRFKVEQLERQGEKTESALEQATRWSGWLLL